MYFRQFWGSTKRADLLASLDVPDINASYEPVAPTADDRYSFTPTRVSQEYRSWPKLEELGLEAPYQGLAEDRRKSLIDIDRQRLEERMRLYFDKSVSWDELRRRGGPLVDSYVDFKAEEVREQILKMEVYEPSRIRRFTARPFDGQWCYYTPQRPVWRRNRPEFVRQAWDGNGFLLTRFNSSDDEEGAVLAFTESICDYHALSAMAVAFPMMLREDAIGPNAGQTTLFAEGDRIDNLSAAAKRYLDAIGWTSGQVAAGWPTIWMHALAVGSSPAYLRENRAGLRRDMPRIPMPVSPERLATSATLGTAVAALLNTETHVPGVTSGTVRPSLRSIAVPTRVGGGQLNPAVADLDLTAGWGSVTSDRKVMPGLGRHTVRDYTGEELSELNAQASADGRGLEAYLDCLGRDTLDVYLNDRAYWRNVPSKVWSYAITGDQVLKKWLSYRERAVLGRPLAVDEVRYVTSVCRRITTLLLMSPELDLNYLAVKAAPWNWVP